MDEAQKAVRRMKATLRNLAMALIKALKADVMEESQKAVRRTKATPLNPATANKNPATAMKNR